MLFSSSFKRDIILFASFLALSPHQVFAWCENDVPPPGVDTNTEVPAYKISDLTPEVGGLLLIDGRLRC